MNPIYRDAARIMSKADALDAGISDGAAIALPREGGSLYGIVSKVARHHFTVRLFDYYAEDKSFTGEQLEVPYDVGSYVEYLGYAPPYISAKKSKKGMKKTA